jgi:hypothetical protein
MDNNHDLLQNDLLIDSTAHGYLKETGKWAAFLGILGFIFSGVVIIVSFFIGAILDRMFSALAATSTSSVAAFGAMGGTFAGFYFFLGVLTFFLSLFLFRFGSKMKQALSGQDPEAFNLSLKNLKNYYRLVGILTIIYLSIIVLSVIVVAIVISTTHHY